VGGLIGFLFAIPRASTNGGAGGRPQALRAYYQQNSNLEQISDWLTKILVGASLTQVSVIREAMRGAALAIVASTGTLVGEAVAWALMIHFAAAGFFAGYLFTALFLGGALSRAQQGALQRAQDVQAVSDLAVQVDPAAPTPRVKPQAEEAAERLRKVELSTLHEPEELAAWARAQMTAGQHGRAAEGYLAALRLRPDDLRLRREYAAALAAAFDYIGAIRELEEARRRMSDTTPSDVRGDILLDLMFNYLYREPPDNFNRVIDIGAEYIGDRRLLPDARVYVYLAAAYGQQYEWLSTQSADASVRDPIGQKAVEAAKRALEMDPTWKGALRVLFQGVDPEESDLAIFNRDGDPFRSEFQRLLQ
jgi:tetratricopeptide (TPR) repeat protein